VADLGQDAVQLHGGIGVTYESDVHLYLRRITADRLTYGTPTDHRRRIGALRALAVA
jgi:alkylation response protein AidB-like acyl-CoA dehydrogenase